jgi:hypothetical protein
MRYHAVITLQGVARQRYTVNGGESANGVRLPLTEWGRLIQSLPFKDVPVVRKSLLMYSVPKDSREWRRVL